MCVEIISSYGKLEELIKWWITNGEMLTVRSHVGGKIVSLCLIGKDQRDIGECKHVENVNIIKKLREMCVQAKDGDEFVVANMKLLDLLGNGSFDTKQ